MCRNLHNFFTVLLDACIPLIFFIISYRSNGLYELDWTGQESRCYRSSLLRFFFVLGKATKLGTNYLYFITYETWPLLQVDTMALLTFPVILAAQSGESIPCHGAGLFSSFLLDVTTFDHESSCLLTDEWNSCVVLPLHAMTYLFPQTSSLHIWRAA